MKIISYRYNLLKSLSRIQRIVQKNNRIPILENVLIEVNKFGILTFRTTDLDLEIKETLKVIVNKEGTTTVSANLLYDIIRKLSDEQEITFFLNNENNFFFILSGCSTFQLPCLPKEDFPEFNENNFSYNFNIKVETLKKIINCTQFIISNEEARYYLNGLYLHSIKFEDKIKLRAVSTDGHRLAKIEIDAPEEARNFPGIIIPRKMITELKKISNEVDNSLVILVEISKQKIRFNIESTVITSKLIDGRFPDYEKVIPISNKKKLVINRSSFVKIVDKISIISRDREKSIKLSLVKNQLTLTVKSMELAIAKDNMIVEYDDQNIDIGFNSHYLLEISRNILSEKIIFMLENCSSPALIYDEKSKDVIYVLMPMRI